MKSSRARPLRGFYAPRYWPVWLILLALRGFAPWPFGWQLRLGKRLGHLLALRAKGRRTAATNLEICFPALRPEQRDALLEAHFESLGASFAEMSLAWFAPAERLRRLIRVEGRQHLDEALGRGRGVILFTAHFTTLEMGISILRDLCPGCSGMYRPQRNAMMDAIITKGRSRFFTEQIPRDNVRALLRSLRDNGVVVYLPDQTYLGKQSALLPFFGEPAVTNIATSRLARLSGAVVLPYFFRRLPADAGYSVEIGPPLDDFPSDDPLEDTRQLFGLLEDYIRKAPEQYLWTYRKFKGRPPPYRDPYRATGPNEPD